MRLISKVLLLETALLAGLVISQGQEFVQGHVNFFNYTYNSIVSTKKIEKSKTSSNLEKKLIQPKPIPQKLKSFEGFEHVDQYDSLITQYTQEWNQKFSNCQGYQNLDPNLVKSMICQETGSHQEAFEHDPMQIANQGDFALKILRDGGESGIPREGYSEFKGIRETPRKDGQWDYSNSDMTRFKSIEGGIIWVIHKAQKFNEQGQSIGFRPWSEALERYNGSQNKKQYAQRILNRLK